MSIDKNQIFSSQRPYLLAVAYRLLGSRTDAEDVLQDAWIRWQEQDVTAIDTPEAFLTTVVTRLGIDHLRKENHRSRYRGPWLPEPVADIEVFQSSCPSDTHERYQSLSMAFLLLLERLNPVERAVYLLRDIFCYSHDEIAVMVEKSVENCRQIEHRARQQLGQGKKRFELNPQKHQQLLTGFVHALALGDVVTLQNLLTADVVLTSDGGGVVQSVLRPLVGIERIGRFIRALHKRHRGTQVTLQPAMLNGAAGFIISVDAVIATAITFEWQDNQICSIFMTRNPGKLKYSMPPEMPSP